MRRTRSMLAIVPLAAVAGLVLAGFWGFSYDDAFITYRYARTFQEEGRLAFGPGAPTYGTSAPGFAVLLGALARLGVPVGLDIPAWGSLLGIAGLLAVPLVLLRWTAGRNGEVCEEAVPWLVCGSVLLLTLRWNVEMLGAETLPALGLASLACWLLFDREREVAAGLCLAAAVVLRLDAGLAALVFGLVYWGKRRTLPWRLLLAGSLPIVLYLFALLLHFGQLLPDTLDAKQGENAFATASMSSAQWLWLVRTTNLEAAGILLGLAVLGVVVLIAKGVWKRPAVAAVSLWLLSHELAYRLIEVPFAPWYHVATLAGLVLVASYGAANLAKWLVGLLGFRSAGPTFRLATTALLLLPLWIPTFGWLVDSWRKPPDPRWEVYHAVGEHLRTASAPGDEVAAVEIGFLGYSSQRPILDLMGLVTPEAIEARREDRLAEWVVDRQPRYILDVPLFHEVTLGPILDHPEIGRCWLPTARFSAPQYMGGEVLLLEHRDDGRCR